MSNTGPPDSGSVKLRETARSLARIPASLAVALVPLAIFWLAPQSQDIVAGLFDRFGPWSLGLLALAEAALALSAWHWARAVLQADGAGATQDERKARIAAGRVPIGLVALTTIAPFLPRIVAGGRVQLYDGLLLALALLMGGASFLLVVARRRFLRHSGTAPPDPPIVPPADPWDPLAALAAYPSHLFRLLARAPFGAFVSVPLALAPAFFVAYPIQRSASTPIAAILSLALLVPVLTLVHDALSRLGFLCVAVVILCGAGFWVGDGWLGPATPLTETGLAIVAGFLLCLGFRALRRSWPWLLVTLPSGTLAATVCTIVMLLLLRPPAGMYNIAFDRPEGQPAGASPRDTRPTLETALHAWAAACYTDTKTIPVTIVALEGGALLSAVWSLSTMRFLDEQTGGEFGRSVFAISAVSGGSLGAATYREWVRRPGRGCDSGMGRWAHVNSDAGGHDVDPVRAFGSADYLAGSIGAFLLTDPIRRLFGALPEWVWGRVDNRGEALSHAFRTLGWNANPASDDPRHFATEQMAPQLLLNGTDVDLGSRVITSTLQLGQTQFGDSEDLLANGCVISLGTAVLNASRFPFISPTGQFTSARSGAGPAGCDKHAAETAGFGRSAITPHQLVDGGYYDNHGAETALDLVVAIEDLNSSTKDGTTFVPIVVVISDSTDWPIEELGRNVIHCGPDVSAYTSGYAVAATPLPRTHDNIEALAPVIASLRLRGAHDRSSLMHLRDHLCGGKAAHFLHLDLPKPDPSLRESAPLNWVLDKAALDFMLDDEAAPKPHLTHALHNPYNRCQAERLRAALGLEPSAAPSCPSDSRVVSR